MIQSQLNHLPTELWRKIFIDATNLYSFQCTSYLSHFDFEEPFKLQDSTPSRRNALRDEFRNSRQTHMAILHVSRLFHSISRELLFVFLFIRTESQLQRIADALNRSTVTLDDGTASGPGRLVRRIHLDLDRYAPPGTLATKMAEIFKHCPKLEIYQDDSEGRGDLGRDADVLFSTKCLDSIPCKQALRFIQWPRDKGPGLTTLSSYNDSLQGLEVLSLLSIGHEETVDLASIPPLSFPRLHSLTFLASPFWGTEIATLADWDFPMLKHVVCWGGDTIIDHIRFFNVHGPKIRTLQLKDVHSDDFDVAAIVASCAPSLEDLTIDSCLHSFTLTTQMPRLRRLGIRGTDIISDINIGGLRQVLDFVRPHFDTFSQAGLFPSLELVRLVDFPKETFTDVSWSIRNLDVWVGWMDIWETMGVRFEDSEGSIAHPPSDLEPVSDTESSDEWDSDEPDDYDSDDMNLEYDDWDDYDEDDDDEDEDDLLY